MSVSKFNCAIVGAVVISLDDHLTFVSSLAASASMINCFGPALTTVEPSSVAEVLVNGGQSTALAGTTNIGPFGGYGELHGWTKLVMILQMVFGRLELLTVLALLSPNFWRR